VPRLDDARIDELVVKAWEARLNAYAPYSQFHVGSALIAADGRIFTGANVENASLGLSMCAERVALGSAVSAGVRSFAAIAIAGSGPDGVTPCGACRQALSEFNADLIVLRCRPDGTYGRLSLADLVPSAFTGRGIGDERKTPVLSGV
jgi:cytidine deaminase